MENREIVRALIVNDEGNILALRNAVRNHEEPYAGRWEIPGGTVEEDEGLHEALYREIEEETSLSCTLIEELERIDVIDEESCAACWYYLLEASGDVELSDEHMEYRWVEPGEYKRLDLYYESMFPIPVLKRLEEDSSDR